MFGLYAVFESDRWVVYRYRRGTFFDDPATVHDVVFASSDEQEMLDYMALNA